MVISHGAESYVARDIDVNVSGRARAGDESVRENALLRADELHHLALGPASVVRGIAVACA